MVHRLLTFSFLFLLGAPLFAITVACDGTALVESTQDFARETALSNANESCVRNALFKIYGEETVKNNEWRLRKIYTDSSTFITSSRMISEEFRPDLNSYIVSMEVSVNEADIKNYITENGIVMASEKAKTVLPLIVERTSSSGDGEYWWGSSGKFAPKKTFSDVEKALAVYLAQGNFILMDPFENQISGQVPEPYRYMEMKLNELSELGRLFGAGLVASGYIWTDCKRPNSAAKTLCETTLSIQMISTETSKISAAKRATEKGTADNPEEARTISRARACKLVADSLVYQLSKKWDKRLSNNFKVSIRGIRTYGLYSKVKKCILGSQIPGLYSVVERYQSRGLFVFEGERRSDVNIILNSLESNCFSEMGTEVTTANTELIEIKI